MWPPVRPEDITLEMIFYAWNDRVLIKKALLEADMVLESELKL